MRHSLPVPSSLVLFVALAMRVLSTPTANLSFLLLAGYATLGRAQAIQALALSWFFSMLSPGIAAEATLGAVGRYAVIAGAVLSVLLRSGLLEGRLSVRWPVAATMLLGGFLVTHSLLVSPLPDVSILKAIAWTAVMATLLSAWHGLAVQERESLIRQIFNGLVVVLVVSLPFLLHPLGYLRNGTGFQGVLNHPQAFGPTMALLGAWAASRMFAERRPAWSNILLVGVCMLLVLVSEARTAGLALVLSLTISFVAAPALAGKRLRRILPGLRSRRVGSVFGIVAMAGIVMASNVTATVEHYISKSGRAGEVSSLLAAYGRSRGGLMDEMWLNISEKPLIGIGFGMASNPDEMQVKRDALLGLPLSASIEKGVLPLAVLEELGMFGFLLVCSWMWMLIHRSANGGITPLAITCTALLLNMGEFMFFSPGGMGLLMLVVVGWAASSIRQHERA